MAIWNARTGCYLECYINFFFAFHGPCIHIQMFRISHEHALFLNGLGYLFFFGFRLLFREI